MRTPHVPLAHEPQLFPEVCATDGGRGLRCLLCAPASPAAETRRCARLRAAVAAVVRGFPARGPAHQDASLSALGRFSPRSVRPERRKPYAGLSSVSSRNVSAFQACGTQMPNID